MRRARLVSFSCVIRSRTLPAAVGVMVSKLVSVIGCWFCSIIYTSLYKGECYSTPQSLITCQLDVSSVSVVTYYILQKMKRQGDALCDIVETRAVISLSRPSEGTPHKPAHIATVAHRPGLQTAAPAVHPLWAMFASLPHLCCLWHGDGCSTRAYRSHARCL